MGNMNIASLLTRTTYSPPKLLGVTSGLQGIDAHTCTHGRDTFAWRSHTSHQITSHRRKRLYTAISRRLCPDTALSCSSGSQCCSVSVRQPNVICENMVPRLHSFQPPPRGHGCCFVRSVSVFLRVHGVIWWFMINSQMRKRAKENTIFKSFVSFNLQVVITERKRSSIEENQSGDGAT